MPINKSLKTVYWQRARKKKELKYTKDSEQVKHRGTEKKGGKGQRQEVESKDEFYKIKRDTLNWKPEPWQKASGLLF